MTTVSATAREAGRSIREHLISMLGPNEECAAFSWRVYGGRVSLLDRIERRWA